MREWGLAIIHRERDVASARDTVPRKVLDNLPGSLRGSLLAINLLDRLSGGMVTGVGAFGGTTSADKDRQGYIQMGRLYDDTLASGLSPRQAAIIALGATLQTSDTFYGLAAEERGLNTNEERRSLVAQFLRRAHEEFFDLILTNSTVRNLFGCCEQPTFRIASERLIDGIQRAQLMPAGGGDPTREGATGTLTDSSPVCMGIAFTYAANAIPNPEQNYLIAFEATGIKIELSKVSQFPEERESVLAPGP